ncbi:MAG: hypothetical protein FWE31_04275 [Firmicutes bacterium]|nr:hypothetical protein [Bacillota bacterium]
MAPPIYDYEFIDAKDEKTIIQKGILDISDTGIFSPYKNIDGDDCIVRFIEGVTTENALVLGRTHTGTNNSAGFTVATPGEDKMWCDFPHGLHKDAILYWQDETMELDSLPRKACYLTIQKITDPKIEQEKRDLIRKKFAEISGYPVDEVKNFYADEETNYIKDGGKYI